ncbi:MAG TPA: PrsW family glutamic-type intramembrane protease [Saprospiraceae bacterium]|nr:PrsW family glutamic-type intramembrane protease [Saprospiraceae bacterium]
MDENKEQPHQLPEVPKPNYSQSQEMPQNFSSKMSDTVTDWAGVERLEGFKLGDVFSEALKKHSRDEVEEYFTVGAPSTTPSIENVDTSWPRPWVFLRTFIAAAVIYFIFVQAWHQYENEKLIPGLIMVGSFAVPISALIFFFEMNARKNVSLYQVIRLLFLGGIISIVVSLIFYDLSDGMKLDWLGASLAGLAEEPGKLMALIIVVNITKYRYTLNGLLFGAAIGTGFAAFESAGYALQAVFFTGSSGPMLESIMHRGMLSPFGHIIWTAMCGAALWKIKGGNQFKFEMLQDPRFYRVFIMAVILHMIWNSPIVLPFYAKNIILGIVGWIIIFSLIQSGLKQIKEEKTLALQQNDTRS